MPDFPARAIVLSAVLLCVPLSAAVAADRVPGAGASAAPRVATATLPAPERALIAAIDRRQADALALLERAVNINSGSLNREGVRAVGALFASELEAIGLATRWVDGAAFDRAGHLIAKHPGSGPGVLLIGHLDTVFEPASPFQRYRALPGGRARGPGVIDMKGGDVVITLALAALAEVGGLDDLDVTVVLIGDEESSGRPLSAARQALIDAARDADVALGFEDGDGDPRSAVIARRGYAAWRLEVSGTPAHSSLIFRDAIGYGAAFEMARILDGFRQALADEQYLTFNPALVLAGSQIGHEPGSPEGHAFGKDNVIPAHASASGDLRTLSAEQERSARQRMSEIVARSLPGTHAELTFVDGYPPLAPSDGNRQLLAWYDQASRDLGFGTVAAVDPAAAGAADISFTAGHVRMALDGLGLMGSGGHTEEETADLGTLGSQSKRAALLLYRLRTAL